MAKMNYPKRNKFDRGSLDLRDEQKSLGERWLAEHDPKAVQPPKKAKRKQRRR